VTRGQFGVLAGVFVFAALVVGCGSGSGSDSSLTKVEYVKQADAICLRQNNVKGQGIQDAYTNPKKAGIQSKGNKAQEELLTKVALPPIATMAEELGELDPPSADKGKAEAMVAALEEENKKLAANPASILSGGGEFLEANKFARELGLKDCAQI
jgi:hypothetical protein